MGIHDREYYRGGEPSWETGDGAPSTRRGWTAVKALILVNALVYLVQMGTYDAYSRPAGQGVTPLLWLDSTRPWELWRLLTADFCHSLSSLWHLLLNMSVLWMLGPDLERKLGRREMLGFYLAAGVFSSAIFLAWHLGWGVHSRAVGASGAVLGVFAALAMLEPRRVVNLFFDIELRWLFAIVALGDLLPMFRALASGELTPEIHALSGASIAYMGHVGGMLFGVLYVLSGARLTSLALPRRAKPAAAPADWKVLERAPDATDLDRQVDRILAKIASAGEECLTDDERLILEQASRVYRDKQGADR